VLVASLTAIALLATGAVVVGALGAALAALGDRVSRSGHAGCVADDSLRSRPRRRINDLVWAIALVPAFALAGLACSSMFAVALAWALAGAIAGLIGIAQARLVLRPDLARA